MAKKCTPAKTGRPKKGKRAATHPYIKEHPDFPLSFHKGTGRFYKTHRGRRYYFGTEPVPAKRQFDAEWSYIIRGLPIPEDEDIDAIRVGDLIDKWLADRGEDAEDGKLKPATLAEYDRVGQYVADKLDRDAAVHSLVPDDFGRLHRALTRDAGNSPTVLKRRITIARMPFKWGFDMALIDAVRFGPKFKLPKSEDIEQARRERGRQTYTPEELKAIIDAANPTLKAAVLLGINGGYTQKEVAELRSVWLDADAGVLDHLRGKTKATRRVPLWPETLAALEAVPKHKPKASARGLVFVTREGKPYHQDHPVRIDGIGQMFDRLTKKLKINLDQAGFGKLRATHRTASNRVMDDNACKIVMGHKLKGVDPNYIRNIDDDRLRAVVGAVHKWLFDNVAKAKP